MKHKILQNTRKPKGIMGRMVLRGMNAGHGLLSEWAFANIKIPKDARSLDVGCGGGANIARLLERCPDGFVDGLDYSGDSVAVSRKRNAAFLGKRCEVQQGDVGALPYEENTFDLVTGFETVYFWPDIPRALSEILRVLKPGGRLMLVCEASDPTDTTWTNRIEGMTVYSGEELSEKMEQAGFRKIFQKKEDKGWICLIGEKSE
ncbi:class I SAM-dependent methyltransferase [Christensenella tenuis]|uniref:Class I SAM-dependent methyltransferase n=1 Tax=Christensenella tenuis TaxID=2763033 RepID=A0ABR7EGH3_9FIRM|nr:class I SAM-dependent methyltransferase [Christensenella tenuis]MBC5648880.1 class I SAM-dependent methyltransferase [Christensenella tenuis]